MSSDSNLILSVDTSTSASSVSLTTGDVSHGKCVGIITLNGRITHSRRLLTSVEWLLSQCAVSIRDVDGIAIGLGPGSFTGLRIGMATVKGLAMAAKKPLLGVVTLDALAVNCSSDKPVCALLDARKKEVYTAWYAADDFGTMRRCSDIRALSPGDLAAEIDTPVLMVGDGVLAYGELFQEKLGKLLSLAPMAHHYPSASAIGFLSAEMLTEGRVLDLESAVPCYVRASDAELSLVGKKEQK